VKVWTSLDAQVQRHLDRGLELGDVERSHFAMFLYSSNYYRVSGYARCFYDPSKMNDRYREGTKAATLMDVYDLDRAVRNAVLDGVSVVEPTLRSRVAYHLTRVIGGGDAYLSEELYLPEGSEPDAADETAHRKWVSELNNRNHVLASLTELQGRDEIFIRHHLKKGEPIPFWAAIEVVSIGTFSRFLRALRDRSVLDPVVTSLDFEDERKFLQAVQNIAFIRNIAAHHGRLWNRRLDGYVTLPKIALEVKRGYLAPKTPAAAFTLLAGMVDQIEKKSAYSNHLLNLVHSTPEIAEGYYVPIL